MHVKAAIKCVSLHHSDGFYDRERFKETVLLLLFYHLPLFPANSALAIAIYGLSVDKIGG